MSSQYCGKSSLSPPPCASGIRRVRLLLSLSVGHRLCSQRCVSTRPCSKDGRLTCWPCLHGGPEQDLTAHHPRAPTQLWLGDFAQPCPPRLSSVQGSLRPVSSTLRGPQGSSSAALPSSALLGNSLEAVPWSTCRAPLPWVFPRVWDGCPLYLMPRILEICISGILCGAVAVLFCCFR